MQTVCVDVFDISNSERCYAQLSSDIAGGLHAVAHCIHHNPVVYFLVLLKVDCIDTAMGNQPASCFSESPLISRLPSWASRKEGYVYRLEGPCGGRDADVSSHVVAEPSEASHVDIDDCVHRSPLEALADEIDSSASESFTTIDSIGSSQLVLKDTASGSLNRDARVDLGTSRCSTDGRDDNTEGDYNMNLQEIDPDGRETVEEERREAE
jgi:hypothetical protein